MNDTKIMATGNNEPYVKVKQQSLECIICMDKYRRPKALTCLHSFCEECLEGTPKSNPRMIKCPICRKDWVLPENGVKGLPDNFLIISLLDEAAAGVGGDGDEGQGDGVRLSCTSCADGEAFSQCLDCYKLLCSLCKEEHLRQAETNTHNIATLEDVKAGNIQPRSIKESKLARCQDHDGKPMDTFCCLCGVQVCVECIQTSHPAPEHHLIAGTEAKQHCQESLRRIMAKALNTAASFREVGDQLEARQKDMNNQIDVVKLRVVHDAEAIVAKVHEEKESILGEIERVQKEKNYKCAELKRQLETTENKAREAYDAARKAVEKGDDSLLDMFPTLLDNLQNLPDEMGELKSAYTRPPGYAAVASQLTGNLLGKVLDTPLLRLDQCYEVRAIPKLVRGIREKRFTFAYGVAVCDNGDLVITDRDDQTVYRLSSNGQFKFRLNSLNHKRDGDFGKPRDVAVASNGDIFVVDHSKHVKVYNSGGEFNRRFVPQDSAGNISQLRCIRITRHKEEEILLVGDLERQELTLHRLDGALIKRLHLTLRPCYMAVNPKNQILLTDYNNARLECINLEGEVKFSIDTEVAGKRMRASGVCWGLHDDIYLALHPESLLYRDHGGVCSIHQYSSNGVYLSCMARGLNNPVHMVFARDGKLVVTNRVSVNWFVPKCV